MKMRMLTLALLASTGAAMACNIPSMPDPALEANPTQMARELSRHRADIVNAVSTMGSWCDLIASSPHATVGQKEDARKLQAALNYVEVRLGSTKVPLEIDGRPAGMDSVYDILRRMGS